jgi:formamidopyrimidine-DNA glycosylase
MPELPEVETVVRGLQPFLIGAQIASVSTSEFRLRFAYPLDFKQCLIGASFTNISRRAKYIIADLNNDNSLIIHLGMSGRISLVGSGQIMSFDDYAYQTGSIAKHDHATFGLIGKDGTEFNVIYNDPRRFGLLDVVRTEEIETSRHFAHLGPEPLSDKFTGAALLNRIGKRATPIKIALLNQEIVVGLGNIYVCEALHMSHIHPETPANSLSEKQANLLVANSKQVLRSAIAAGGSTLKDFAHADGSLGGFQNAFLVYDQIGKPCKTPKCNGQITRVVQAGRSTFFCPACQK